MDTITRLRILIMEFLMEAATKAANWCAPRAKDHDCDAGTVRFRFSFTDWLFRCLADLFSDIEWDLNARLLRIDDQMRKGHQGLHITDNRPAHVTVNANCSDDAKPFVEWLKGQSGFTVEHGAGFGKGDTPAELRSARVVDSTKPNLGGSGHNATDG